MANEITTAQMARVLSVEFANKFNESIASLLQLLDIAEVETISAGTQIERYEITGTLNDGTVTEAATVPYSQYKEELKETIKADIKKYRKGTSEEAILKSGYERAVAKTDAKFLGDIHKAVKGEFFDFIKTGTGTADAGETIKAALAHVAGKLVSASSTNGFEGETKIYFANPEDVYDYLGDAKEATTNTAFGFEYVENFLGLGLTILDAAIDKGEVWGTYVENVNAYAVDLDALREAGFDYVRDETGIVGVAHDAKYDNGMADTHVRTGLKLVPTYVNMIFSADITPAMD